MYEHRVDRSISLSGKSVFTLNDALNAIDLFLIPNKNIELLCANNLMTVQYTFSWRFATNQYTWAEFWCLSSALIPVCLMHKHLSAIALILSHSNQIYSLCMLTEEVQCVLRWAWNIDRLCCLFHWLYWCGWCGKHISPTFAEIMTTAKSNVMNVLMFLLG